MEFYSVKFEYTIKKFGTTLDAEIFEILLSRDESVSPKILIFHELNLLKFKMKVIFLSIKLFFMFIILIINLVIHDTLELILHKYIKINKIIHSFII